MSQCHCAPSPVLSNFPFFFFFVLHSHLSISSQLQLSAVRIMVWSVQGSCVQTPRNTSQTWLQCYSNALNAVSLVHRVLTQGPCIHPAACLQDYLSSVLPLSLLANLFLSPSTPCLLCASIVNHLIFTSLNPFLNCFIHFLVKGVTGVYIAGHSIYCIANLRLYQLRLRGLLVADVSSCLDLVRSHLAFVSYVFQPVLATQTNLAAAVFVS